MVKYYFPTIDGSIFLNLPSSVSRSTIKSIMVDCGYQSCYVIVHGSKLFLDFEK